MWRYLKLMVLLLAALALAGTSFAQLTTCNGGAQKAAFVKTNDLPATTSANNTFLSVPNAFLIVSVPPFTVDTFLITFSAEARLIGNTSPSNWIELRVFDNATPMEPIDLTSPLAFASSDFFESHAASFCKRIANNTGLAATHIFRAVWRLTNNTGAPLTAWVDDWTLHLEVDN